MCGIAGAFARHGALDPHHQQVVQRINQWQAHRGPDGEGFWGSSDRRVMLGHRRLAIIDTGPSGAQPMTDTTGRWTISLNGEIYNYRALRVELEHLGRRFVTTSDTEVLINAIAQWGEGGLKRLRGMFAFALWDDHEKELWLGRDPYGIKPLYTAQTDGTVWFASQARALAECTPISQRREPAALVGYYLWGSVPEPFSWWADIQPLCAGNIQRFSCGTNSSRPQQYYSISAAIAAAHNQDTNLQNVMADSVEHHLVADTEVGVFLSAGIDSNVIASLASAKVKGLKTITLAFKEYEGTSNDEAPLAESAAKRIGSDHRTVRISKAEFEDILPDFFQKMDQPTIDGLNAYLVSKVAARQGLKVVLSGLGGDELFGGYPSFHQIPRLLGLAWLAPVVVPIGRIVERVSREVAPKFFASKLGSVLSHSGNIFDAYALRRCVFLKEALDLLLDRGWIEEGLVRLGEARSQEAAIEPLKHTSLHAQIAALESCCYMRNQLLRDADWAGMAHSVEIRVPFVDRCVLEALGPWIASKHPPRKVDLAALAPQLSAELLRRPKTGFFTPAHQWAAGDQKKRGLAHWTSLVPHLMRNSAFAASRSGSVAQRTAA
jgi:asparagine synthase (glutamine-hydrolysing)